MSCNHNCNEGRSCPARSCDELGVCQCRTPRCAGCEESSPAAQVYSLITVVLYGLLAVLLAGAVGLAAGVFFGTR